MEPCSSYTQTSNFDSISTTGSRSSAILDHSPTHSSRPHSQLLLPPFSEILQSQHMAPLDPYSHQHLNHHAQADDHRAYHSSSGVRRSGHPSPELQPGVGTDGYDSLTARNLDSGYPDSRHHRPSSSWTSNSQFSDMVSPTTYAHPRLQFPRGTESLPPLRDVANNFDPSYHPAASPYPQPYVTTSLGASGLDTGSYPGERPAYYDPTQRYGQTYSHTNRPHAPPSQMDYYRYAQPGTPYQTPPYVGADYASPSIGVHHPSSPTVCTDADSRNRRRRGNLPKQITDVLRGWFHEHLDHPYPTEEDKQAFAARTGLSINQISNWFINARRRHLPALRQARDRGAQISTADYDSDQLRRPHHH